MSEREKLAEQEIDYEETCSLCRHSPIVDDHVIFGGAHLDRGRQEQSPCVGLLPVPEGSDMTENSVACEQDGSEMTECP